MARKGIVLDFIANVSPFRRGTKEAQAALDAFGDSLTDVARDGAKAGERLETSFRDAAQAVNRSSDQMKAQAGTSFRDIGTEAGAEFSQNFGEAIRSGNPADAIVETVTSLGGALGGVGLVLAGAFGIGAAIAGEIEKAKERVRTASNGLFDAARQGAIDAAAKEDFVNAILGTDSWAESLRKLAPLARAAGVPIGDVVAEIESGGRAATGLDRALDAAKARADLLGASNGPQQVAAALGPAGKAAQELAGFYSAGADALAQQNELLRPQRDIALNSIREVERAGRTAAGVTRAERYEMTRPGG